MVVGSGCSTTSYRKLLGFAEDHERLATDAVRLHGRCGCVALRELMKRCHVGDRHHAGSAAEASATVVESLGRHRAAELILILSLNTSRIRWDIASVTRFAQTHRTGGGDIVHGRTRLVVAGVAWQTRSQSHLRVDR